MYETVRQFAIIFGKIAGKESFDSTGSNVKIRGTPHQIFERYTALAREASTGGDGVAAENLYQHAEHYFRVKARYLFLDLLAAEDIELTASLIRSHIFRYGLFGHNASDREGFLEREEAEEIVSDA